MRLLDLFCGAGGAAMGYHQAGFTDIIGVDIGPQPNYPFTFMQADVLDLTTVGVADLVHASPPCQAYTTMGNRWRSPRPALIAPTRHLLEKSGRPYVIENVAGAVRFLRDPMMFTGEMFGLTTSRPRYFELGGWFTMSPPRMVRMKESTAIYGAPDGRRLFTRQDGSQLRAWSSLEEGKAALGVPWMTTELEIREAIPPAYTQFIGEQFLAQRKVTT